jgi:hypothetical protein
MPALQSQLHHNARADPACTADYCCVVQYDVGVAQLQRFMFDLLKALYWKSTTEGIRFIWVSSQGAHAGVRWIGVAVQVTVASTTLVGLDRQTWFARSKIKQGGS